MISTAGKTDVLDTEATFVEALQSRSESAWSELYDRYYGTLHRYVYARTSDPQASEDIAAESFLQALKGIGAYRYRGKPLLAWLYRITHNLVADHLERKRRTPAVGVPDDIATAQPAWAAEPASGIDPASTVQGIDLRAALSHLKSEHREVISLHYYAGLTIPEIAGALGKKERAVYSLHERAVAALRRKMTETPSSPGVEKG